MKYQAYVDELIEWLKIPSVSSEDKYVADVRQGAEWLVERLRKVGFEAEAIESSFNPVVVGSNLSVGKDKPTLLVYGHYDVQAAEPLEEWKGSPFEPEIRDGNLYGRGTADDKGQFYTWVAAWEEILRVDGVLPVNIKVIAEGAEEEGSKGLSEFVKKHKDLLTADVCVLSDSHCLSEAQPVITYGLRGLCYFDLKVRTLRQDAHSGIYGGNVRNAANELARLISKLKDESGKVLIPGFYENVRNLSEKEEIELASYPMKSEDVLAETGARIIHGEKNRSIPERAGARPTLDVNGLWSGYMGAGSKTIIPAEAGAKVSMRLVANQSSKEIALKFRRFIESEIPDGVEVEVVELAGAEPVLMDRNSKYFRAAEKAYEKIFGNKPVYELSGGSIGVTMDFQQILGIDSVMMGYGLPDDGLHAPNEKLSLSMFEKGVDTNIEFLKLVSEDV